MKTVVVVTIESEYAHNEVLRDAVHEGTLLKVSEEWGDISVETVLADPDDPYFREL